MENLQCSKKFFSNWGRSCRLGRMTTLLTALTLVVSAFSGLALAESKPVLLKVPSVFPTSLPGISHIHWIADAIETASDGNIRMKIYEPGKLVAPFEVLDAVSRGKVNAGYSISAYWEGKMPGASIFTAIPFGPGASEFMSWMFHGNGLKLYQKMYDDAGYNVHVVPCVMVPAETAGWFKKPITSLEDFKGLKIRFMGLGAKVLSKLGASVNLLPAGEIFPALEKNAIDGSEFSNPAIDAKLGFRKIAKYNYFPGWHQQSSVVELLINKNTWNSMSEGQRKLIELTGRAGLLDSLAYADSIQAAVIEENKVKYGAEAQRLSPEILAGLEQAWGEVAMELSATSPMFKEAWQDQSAFRKDYKVWSDLSLLPAKK